MYLLIYITSAAYFISVNTHVGHAQSEKIWDDVQPISVVKFKFCVVFVLSF